MDALIEAAGRALAVGDALGALDRVALRSDPAALALRGIAMAQLGDYPRARQLLRRAAREFAHHDARARARCVVADAEVALAMRDFGGSTAELDSAARILHALADHANAMHARVTALRRLIVLGRLGEAKALLASLDRRALPPALSVIADLADAELHLRSLKTAAARLALDRASEAAERARVPALQAEVVAMRTALHRPAARQFDPIAGQAKLLRLDEVEHLLHSGLLVVDACRRGLRLGDEWMSLGRRPVLFELVRTLAEAWPGDVDRQSLIRRAFRIGESHETLRARLRVSMGRLRAIVAPWTGIEPTGRGYALVPRESRRLVLLLPPVDGDSTALLALLADGMPWSTSALALALGESQRSIQRALVDLERARSVRSIGRGRAQRWIASGAGFTTILLLPHSAPNG